jgi:hypothetical protein
VTRREALPCRRDKHSEDAGYYGGLVWLMSALHDLPVSMMVVTGAPGAERVGIFGPFVCRADPGRLNLTCCLWDQVLFS